MKLYKLNESRKFRKNETATKRKIVKEWTSTNSFGPDCMGLFAGNMGDIEFTRKWWHVKRKEIKEHPAFGASITNDIGTHAVRIGWKLGNVRTNPRNRSPKDCSRSYRTVFLCIQSKNG